MKALLSRWFGARAAPAARTLPKARAQAQVQAQVPEVLAVPPDVAVFRVVRSTSGRDSLGDYKFIIYRKGRVFATYSHDFRGDEPRIRFENGEKESRPVGGVKAFLEGGGPAPLRLSTAAVDYLERRASRLAP
jgi:hypothetical protein